MMVMMIITFVKEIIQSKVIFRFLDNTHYMQIRGNDIQICPAEGSLIK